MIEWIYTFFAAAIVLSVALFIFLAPVLGMFAILKGLLRFLGGRP